MENQCKHMYYKMNLVAVFTVLGLVFVCIKTVLKHFNSIIEYLHPPYGYCMCQNGELGH